MKELSKAFTCRYLLPCGYCDKFDKKCTHNESVIATGTIVTKEIKDVSDSDTASCNHEWEPLNTLNTAGYVYKCKKCGTMKTEPMTSFLHEYTTTRGNEDLNKQYSLWNSDSSDPCEHCPNNPKNGGSGVCHCILGLPKVTCTSGLAISTNTYSNKNYKVDFNKDTVFVTGMCTEEDLKNQPTLEELANMTTVASTGSIIANNNSSNTNRKKRKL